MTQKNHRAKYMSVHIYTLSSTTVAVGSSTSKHKQHWSLICAHQKFKLIINVYSLHKLNTHTKIHLMWTHPTLNKSIRWSHAQTHQETQINRHTNTHTDKHSQSSLTIHTHTQTSCWLRYTLFGKITAFPVWAHTTISKHLKACKQQYVLEENMGTWHLA